MGTIISNNPHVQAHYETCIAAGTSETLAEMFALGQPPASDSDREFWADHPARRADEHDPTMQYYREVAKENGTDTAGRIYLSQLADYPGDPRAWVSGKDDVKRVCEDRGLGCSGSLKIKAPTGLPPAPRKSLGDDIIEDGVARMVAADPALKTKRKEELAEKYIAEHSGPSSGK